MVPGLNVTPLSCYYQLYFKCSAILCVDYCNGNSFNLKICVFADFKDVSRCSSIIAISTVTVTMTITYSSSLLIQLCQQTCKPAMCMFRSMFYDLKQLQCSPDPQRGNRLSKTMQVPWWPETMQSTSMDITVFIINH